jgi:hypothetical protein
MDCPTKPTILVRLLTKEERLFFLITTGRQQLVVFHDCFCCQSLTYATWVQAVASGVFTTIHEDLHAFYFASPPSKTAVRHLVSLLPACLFCLCACSVFLLKATQ